MRTISLFSGCGGMDIGAVNAGAEIVFANDINKDACDTLSSMGSHQTTKIIHKPINKISSFPEAELLIGGYPCQSFSMGGNRKPELDNRSELYKEYARCLRQVRPRYFIAENVSGLKSLKDGKLLSQQIAEFSNAGPDGYSVSHKVLNAKDFGLPQNRKRLFIVGVRGDLGSNFEFPFPTHGPKGSGLARYTSHGEVIKDLPLWPEGEFYHRDDANNFSWYFMSRNRKAAWSEPSYTMVANWRHATLHPASPSMIKISSNLKDGFKQVWGFSEEYEHLQFDGLLPKLEFPRRLSWRECARIQTFPDTVVPVGDVMSKYSQIGNAVPPRLAEILIKGIVSGKSLKPSAYGETNVNKLGGLGG